MIDLPGIMADLLGTMVDLPGTWWTFSGNGYLSCSAAQQRDNPTGQKLKKIIEQ